MNYLTSEAKAKLSSTIRELRDRLLTDIHDTVDSTYRLSLPIEKAGLAEEQRVKRSRLEQWLQEQDRDLEIARLEAEKLAAATFLNRLVVIKQLEALELIKPKVVTGGWQSPGYRDFREFAPDLCKDDSEGFGTLLRLLYDEWALDLPGLFGKVGVTQLLPVPSVTLRATVEALNDPELDSAWLDDTTLGWVYQFWNDPDRKALDDKINNRGKIEHHEIAAKTQIFTERYMVEWLLQNSLNQQWLAICAKNNWTPEVKANGTLDNLEEKRKQWREKRESGEVSPEKMMPINGSQEEQWKYWVSQPLLPETIKAAPKSIKELKLIDPAVGSGHFLVIAFSLLFSFYKEEAQHRGETWTDKKIAELIIENNLHGVDLDARAVQIAAAALFLKAKSYCADAHPRWMNLVASNLGLSSLPIESPEVNELQLAIYQATGIPADLIAKIIQALHGADHLGSLLKIDEAIENAIAEYERQIVKTEPVQGDLFTGYPPTQMMLSFDETKKSILSQLGKFLAKCTSGDDLGLRLRGEQLAAGVRFIEIVKENKYHLCVANPPYLGMKKLKDVSYLNQVYPHANADLYSVFIERGIQLLRKFGSLGMIAMSSWMFLSDFEKFRKAQIKSFGLNVCAHMGKGGGFSDWDRNPLMQTAMFVATRELEDTFKTTWFRLDSFINQVKYAALLANEYKYERSIKELERIAGQPFVYWWDNDFLDVYKKTPKIVEKAPVKYGLITGNNTRFILKPWEISINNLYISKLPQHSQVIVHKKNWSPIVKGVLGQRWIETISNILRWKNNGLEIKIRSEFKFGSFSRLIQNEFWYFKYGVAFNTVGANFSAKAHRFASIFSDAGCSVFHTNPAIPLCLMNSLIGKNVLESLNPTVNFQVGDVSRLPLFPIKSADEIFDRLDRAFTEHEAARETSVEFRQPAPSPWNYAQEWAQQAVDRPAGKPLPEYEPVYDDPLPTDYVSYAVGVALGRFTVDRKFEGEEKSEVLSLKSQVSNTEVITYSNTEKNKTKGNNTEIRDCNQNAEGEKTLDFKLQSEESNTKILNCDQKSEDEKTLDFRLQTLDFKKILPNGILYLSNYSEQDSLEHPASQVIKTAWQQHGEQIAANKPLRKWLRESFFKDVHLKMYEKRPIYLPLSSEKKNFVALINIHRWTDNTLQTLLADHLKPELTKLEGELKDLREAQTSGNRGNQNRYATVQKLGEELQTFIDLVMECAERGAPKHKPQDTARETDARLQMNLDDGVMVNSAALWILLEPQWKDPKKWWSELCNAKGKKDYDWSHLAARYFPKRVDAKCQQDPSLAVAHGCFWQYHPEKAYQWELRLQDEISKNFTIDEVNSDELRQAFEREHPDKVEELKTKEQQRRNKKSKV